MRRKHLLPAVAGILLAIGAGAARAEVRPSRFQNRDAWSVAGPKLRVTLMQSGGHVAEIVLSESKVNPLWIPAAPTIDPETFDPAKNKTWGNSSVSRLLSGLVGHNVCFPFWGNPTEAETRAGMTYHGEAGIRRWHQQGSTGDSITVACDLPESRTRFIRTVRVAGQIAYFEETGENVSTWDRPVGWCEHVTIGPPFLERKVTRLEASLTRGRLEKNEFTWPNGMAEKTIDLREIRDARAEYVNNFQVDPARKYGYFAAVNPKLGLLFGYIFPRADFSWLNIWESNTPAMLTRGMEFSNTPSHGTMKTMVATPALWGTPAYEWIDAKGKLRKRYAAFSARVGAGFRVADVRVSGGKLEVISAQPGKTIVLDLVSGLI